MRSEGDGGKPRVRERSLERNGPERTRRASTGATRARTSTFFSLLSSIRNFFSASSFHLPRNENFARCLLRAMGLAFYFSRCWNILRKYAPLSIIAQSRARGRARCLACWQRICKSRPLPVPRPLPSAPSLNENPFPVCRRVRARKRPPRGCRAACALRLTNFQPLTR